MGLAPHRTLLTQQEFDQLNALWLGRPLQNVVEWNSLYKLVYKSLIPLNMSQYGQLSHCIPNASYTDLKNKLISNFYTDKIFLPAYPEENNNEKNNKKPAAFNPNPLQHQGALSAYYSHYLIDVMNFHGKTGSVVAAIVQNQPPPSVEEDAAEPESTPALFIGAPVRQQVANHALRWLARQPRWVIWYLALHHCCDKLFPLTALRDLCNISDYHNKAIKLGITQAAGGFPSPAAFAETQIGQWLQRDLHISIDDAHKPDIEAALIVLCEVAVNQLQESLGMPIDARHRGAIEQALAMPSNLDAYNNNYLE